MHEFIVDYFAGVVFMCARRCFLLGGVLEGVSAMVDTRAALAGFVSGIPRVKSSVAGMVENRAVTGVCVFFHR